MAQRRSWFVALGAVAVVVTVFAIAWADARSDRLAELLTSSPSYLVRTQSALSLGRLRRPESVPVLIAALSDTHETVRAAAALSLGRIGDPTATAPLERLAHSRGEPTEVAAGARRALELIRARTDGQVASAN
jgi:HEAT repeat protein